MSEIREVEDIQPIFRVSPFLVEKGAKLVKGEKYLWDKSLERVDLLLQDRQQKPLYVEIKWHSFSKEQATSYAKLLSSEGARNFRLMWLIPDDLRVNLPSQIEVKRYSRTEVSSMVEIRRRAKDNLVGILRLLSEPVTPPPGLMLGQSLSFPNIISACYFSSKVLTDRGQRQLGLRKEATGRYLDLIRCAAHSPLASELPELTIHLIIEVLTAPYFFEMRGARGAVDSKGFHHYMYEKRNLQIYKGIAKIVGEIYQLAMDFWKNNKNQIQGFYGENPSRSDLLYRILLDSPINIFEMGDRISVKGLVRYLIESFNITLTQPVKSFRHSILNIDVTNTVSVNGYENDLAKRLIEIAVLKGALIPTSGVSIIRVLRQDMLSGKFERVPSQSFRLSREEQFIRSFGGAS